VSDARLRDAERALAADPSAWRPLVAELRRAGRLDDARATCLRAWERARDSFDELCPREGMVRGGTREQRRANLARLDALMVDMDESHGLVCALGEELYRNASLQDLCLCDAYPLAHALHLGRRRRGA
jgi:hypothetical protein